MADKLRQKILWLLLALASFLPASAQAPTAPENRIWEIFNTGYDSAGTPITGGYDCPVKSTSAYDHAPMHSTGAETRSTEAECTFFGPNAEFKAAEGGDFVTLYHGTTSNAASKIVSGGFRDADTFFAEDMPTSQYFASEAAMRTGAQSTTTITFTLPRSVAQDLGLLDRQVVGEDRNLLSPDIDGGSGFERILPSENVSTFNSLLEDGTITARRLKH